MNEQTESLDLVWGAKNIAKVLGCTERATFHMLEAGDLPEATQIGRRWVASRKKLRERFEGQAA
ncbi:hypothetical protein [Devosia naphthalenivorans]|uniref:hypothetical protein n=1 Tax=Devosia naphthalenivorans TaxID=2082392 RepID=UPI000D34BB4B|nr:hypothetical protein [Devosia naphthalenivorans]